MFIDNYYFLVNIKDCLILEFDMPQIEPPLKLILSIKVNNYNTESFFFHLYLNTRKHARRSLT